MFSSLFCQPFFKKALDIWYKLKPFVQYSRIGLYSRPPLKIAFWPDVGVMLKF